MKVKSIGGCLLVLYFIRASAARGVYLTASAAGGQGRGLGYNLLVHRCTVHPTLPRHEREKHVFVSRFLFSSFDISASQIPNPPHEKCARRAPLFWQANFF